jgi:peptidylprolyl isomerase
MRVDARIGGLVRPPGRQLGRAQHGERLRRLRRPDVTLSAPVYVDHTVAVDETVGSGLRVTSDMQDVQFAITIMSGSTGQKILTSGTQVTPLSKWREQYAGFAELMTCATEGSRILGAVPASALSAEAAQGWGSPAQTRSSSRSTCRRSTSPRRTARPSTTIAGDALGRAGSERHAGDHHPRHRAAVRPGRGGAQEGRRPRGRRRRSDPDQLHRRHVGRPQGLRLDVGQGASTAVTLDAVVPGFAQALKGQTVGSQILVVIPPSLGYGDKATSSIPAGSTLVFVIDVLGVDTPAAP